MHVAHQNKPINPFFSEVVTVWGWGWPGCRWSDVFILVMMNVEGVQYFAVPPRVHMDSTGLQWTPVDSTQTCVLGRTIYGTNLGLG